MKPSLWRNIYRTSLLPETISVFFECLLLCVHKGNCRHKDTMIRSTLNPLHAEVKLRLALKQVGLFIEKIFDILVLLKRQQQ